MKEKNLIKAWNIAKDFYTQYGDHDEFDFYFDTFENFWANSCAMNGREENFDDWWWRQRTRTDLSEDFKSEMENYEYGFKVVWVIYRKLENWKIEQ